MRARLEPEGRLCLYTHSMREADASRDTNSLNRLHVASSEVSRAILRAHSRQSLLNEVTRILVESGGFAMAYIAWHDPESRQLVPVARCGDDTGYVDHIVIYTDDRPEAQGPGGTAFRTGAPYICNDFAHDEHTRPWRAEAGVSGWLASAGLPIVYKGAPCGLLSIYAREQGFFGSSEVELLRDVAGDIAFGLEHIESQRLKREVEEALAANEQRLRLALESSELGTFDWDLVRGRFHRDRRQEQIYGYGVGEFGDSYEAFMDHVHPDDQAAVSKALEAAALSGGRIHVEFRVVWPDGSIHWAVSRGELTHDEAGTPIRLIGTTADITERVHSTEALRRSEETHRKLFESVPQGVVYQDANGDITSANPAAQRILGLSLGQLRGVEAKDPGWGLFHEDGAPWRTEDHPSMVAVRTGQAVRNVVMYVVKPGAPAATWMLVNSVPLGAPGQERISQVYTTFEDITERKRAEDELRARDARIHHLNEVLLAIRNVQRVLLESSDAMEMLGGVCKSLARTRGYVKVLVAQPDETTKSVRSVADSGTGGDFFSHAPVRWDDGPLGQGPTGTAIRERRTVVFDDISNDPRFAPWRDALIRTGAASIASIPLICRNRMYGVLTVNADRVCAFDEEEIELLTGLGSDVARALRGLEDHAARMEAEAVLRVKDRAIETSITAIAIADPSSNVTYVNASFLQMWGYDDAGEVVGRPILDFWDAPENTIRVLGEMRRDGSWVGELAAVRKNGETFAAELNCSVIKDPEGTPICVMGSFLDITDRKRAEQALRVKDQAIEASMTGFGLADSQGILIYANSALLSMWGYDDASEVLGTPAPGYFESPEEVITILTTLPEVRHWAGELRGCRKNGQTFDAQLSATLILDESGNPLCIQSSVVDVTERKRAETELAVAHAELGAVNASLEQRVIERSRELALSEQRMRMAAEGAGLGAYTVNFETGEFYWSVEFKRLQGLAANEAVVLDEQGVPSGVHPYDHDNLARALAQANHPQGDGLLQTEYRVVTGDGSLRWLGVFARTLFEGEGPSRRPLSRAGVVMDITGRKQVEAALAAAHRQVVLSEERLRMASEGANVGTFYQDLRTGEGFQSAEFKRLHGVQPNEPVLVADGVVPGCVHAEDREALRKKILEAADPGGDGLLRSEHRVVYADGSVHWIASYSRTSFEGEGSARHPSRVAGAVIDITERRLAEDALMSAHEQLALAVEGTGLGMWDWRVQTGDFSVNGNWAKMLGYSREELAPLSIDVWRRLCHPEDLAKAEVELEKKFARVTQLYESEFRMRHKDGHWVPVLSRGKVVERDSADRPVRMVGTHLDISERKRHEAALREATDALAVAVEGSGVGIWNVDLEAYVASVSERYAEMIGYTLEELAPFNLAALKALVHPDDWEGFEAALSQHLAGLTPLFEADWRMRHKDGHWVYTLHRGRETARDAAGKPIRLSGTNLDVSALKKTEERLRTFSEVVEQSPVIVVITTAQHVIEWVNTAFSQITGYGLEEAVGKRPDFISSKMLAQEYYDHLWEKLRSEVDWRGELRSRCKDGSLFWHYTFISPIRNKRGEVVHYAHVSQDITQQKQAAEELRRAKEAAEAANRAKSTFLANMSHEIRTPLNAILGYAQLLQRDPALPSHAASQVATINKSGEHLMNLISDILEMSKIEAGRATVVLKTFDLLPLINDVAEMFRVRAAEKSLDFSVAQSETLPRMVHSDEGKIRQVLVNLLSNAVKFTERGRIEVRCDAQSAGEGSELLRIEVEDTGTGISEEDIDCLFRHFEQTDSGRKLQSGSGLGLAISREFARLMGGDITVSSGEGRGSIFRFEVPVEVAAGTVSSLLDNSRKVIALQRGQSLLRALIVDDIAANRDWVKSLLLLVGADVREAENGEAAVRVWREWKPELVLMDLRMPVLDGLEATRRIKAEPGGERTVILALTAAVFEEDRAAAREAGASDLMGKPLKEAVLFEKIHEYLGMEFVYQDDLELRAESQAHAEEQHPEILSDLPTELRSALSEAALDGDSWRIDSLIKEASTYNQTAAARLRKLAEHYEYEALSELVNAGESK